MQNPFELEKINPDIVFDMAHTAREKTWEAVEAIKSFIRPGMTEKEAIQKANAYFASQGVKKFWHKTHIRFGESTVLSFNDPYREHVVLQETDIFYIDIGPVWDGVEGDCGDTFVMGENPEFTRIKADVKTIFEQTRDYWRAQKPSGVELYQYAQDQTEKMGYLLHPAYVKGHRLSEFPHFAYTKIGTGDLEFSPAPDRWILEFQICDRSMKFGAFYEDLLDEKSSLGPPM